jgi:hypothetical protein
MSNIDRLQFVDQPLRDDDDDQYCEACGLLIEKCICGQDDEDDDEDDD